MKTLLSDRNTTAIQDIVMAQLELNREQVTPESRIIEDLNADSLDVIEISMNLEEQFNITIPDEGWDRVRTVGDIYDAVAGLLERS